MGAEFVGCGSQRPAHDFLRDDTERLWLYLLRHGGGSRPPLANLPAAAALWREEAVAAFKAEYELLNVENAQASFCESMLVS